MNEIIQWIKKRKVISVLILFFLLLVITNPSQTTFKNHLGLTSYSGLKREFNFFIFSIYSESYYPSDKYYFAIAGNFFHLSEKETPTESTDGTDSTTIYTTEAVDSVSAPTYDTNK